MSCPICGRDTVKDVRPFCSKRCADVDLARWFNGGYAVPGIDGEAEGMIPEADPRRDDGDDDAASEAGRAPRDAARRPH